MDMETLCNWIDHFTCLRLVLKRPKEIFLLILTQSFTLRASLLAQIVKRLPAMQETQVRSLGGEDPLEEELATHSSILAQRIQWTEESTGLWSWGHKELDMTEQLILSLLLLTEWKQEKFWWNSDMNHEREAIIPLLESVLDWSRWWDRGLQTLLPPTDSLNKQFHMGPFPLREI